MGAQAGRLAGCLSGCRPVRRAARCRRASRRRAAGLRGPVCPERWPPRRGGSAQTLRFGGNPAADAGTVEQGPVRRRAPPRREGAAGGAAALTRLCFRRALHLGHELQVYTPGRQRQGQLLPHPQGRAFPAQRRPASRTSPADAGQPLGAWTPLELLADHPSVLLVNCLVSEAFLRRGAQSSGRLGGGGVLPGSGQPRRPGGAWRREQAVWPWVGWPHFWSDFKDWLACLI